MNTKKIVFMAIFTALCFIATTLIQFPISMGFGYIHLGDSVVMLSGMLLGPIAGAVAAGSGSALADFTAGYAHYMVATFLVKAALAFVIGLAYRDLSGKVKDLSLVKMIYHIVAAAVVVAGGYFVADMLLASLLIVDTEGASALAYAAFGLPWNALQAVFGAVVSIILYYPLKRPFESIYLTPQH